MDGLIYAYGQPRSNEQQRFIAQRIAQQRRQRRASAWDSPPAPASTSTSPRQNSTSERRSTISSVFTNSTPALREASHEFDRPDSHDEGDMEHAYRTTTSCSASSNRSRAYHQQLLSQPFEVRHGRRFLRDIPYPLPCDLAELQRQNLRTLLACRVFGRAVCAPRASQDIPRRVLEVGCGTGFWSAMCHDYFSSLGYEDVAFTGLDIAPLAPDLSQQGLNWTFVQHDIRQLPLPFDDAAFDLVVLKDLSLVLPFETLTSPSQRMIEESIRLLRPGGTLEVWESDHCLRSLVSIPAPPPNKQCPNADILDQHGMFPITTSTPFAPVENRYLRQANDWMFEALSQRRLPPTPCARISQLLHQEPDHLTNLGMERIAIPLSLSKYGPDGSGEHDRADSPLSRGKARWSDKALTADQISLRQTALMTVVQLIESLEPILREVSGKSPNEWGHWWASMLADLSDPTKGSLQGECLEIGAWWATKLDP